MKDRYLAGFSTVSPMAEAYLLGTPRLRKPIDRGDAGIVDCCTSQHNDARQAIAPSVFVPSELQLCGGSCSNHATGVSGGPFKVSSDASDKLGLSRDH